MHFEMLPNSVMCCTFFLTLLTTVCVETDSVNQSIRFDQEASNISADDKSRQCLFDWYFKT